MTHLKTARSAWESACRAWSRDDCKDVTATMKLGEAMMFAATDLICALEEVAPQTPKPRRPVEGATGPSKGNAVSLT